jgi:cell division protein FtsB
MRSLVILLIILLAVLQYKLWFASGSFVETRHLKKQIAAQKAENAKLEEKNDTLMADTEALKKNSDAIESFARKDLGMIKNDEVFYQVVS